MTSATLLEPKLETCMDDVDNNDAEGLKEILKTDLLDNDLVNTIMNDDVMTKNSGKFLLNINFFSSFFQQ